MGNTQCAFCEIKTTHCQYYYKYKKNICNDCINYIRGCCHCNEWYTNNLIRYNDKLFCIGCLNDLHDYKKPQYICMVCDKRHDTTITHQNKIYCTHCLTKLSSIYKLSNIKKNN